MTTKKQTNNENEAIDFDSCSDEEIKKWQECIRSAIFSDLISLKDLDEDIFSELFYGRTNETSDFCISLETASKTGQNYVILGEAGVGKSSCLYKLLLNKDNELNKSIYPVFIDFRRGSIVLEVALISFIDKVENYFKAVGFPIHTLEKPKESGTIHYNLIKISDHLTEYTPGKKHKTLLLMVDDLDYGDDFWLKFLVYIHHLVVSPKISFVLTMRRFLRYQIRNANDALHRDLVRNAKIIKLGKLSVQKILNKRLAPIIKENEQNSFHQMIKRLFRRDSAMCRILRNQYGIKNLEHLARFEFPFSNKLMNFMALITNGNNREIFDIAEAVLRYIFAHSKELDTRLEEGEKKYIIPREIIIKIFMTDCEKHDSNYELFNLNSNPNKKGNAILYNVLEAVKYNGIINNFTLQILESKMGHKLNEITNSLKILEDRGNRLIVPLRNNEAVSKNRTIVLNTEYEISNKGEKYLEMIESIDWKCYRDEIKFSSDHLKNYL